VLACRLDWPARFAILTGRIPEAFIQTLLERIDISEVVGARVALKPAGRGEFKGLCPFHNEKTPSFTVSTTKQFYHCFGCGAHGTAISFLMDYDGLEFPLAVEDLARLVGMEVPRTTGALPDHTPILAVLDAAQHWFRQQLAADEGARAYLKQRGFDRRTADEFGIGFAPESWQGLCRHLQSEGFGRDALSKAGLIIDSSGRLRDRFRQRVMFPIHDRRGRVVAFGGRAIGEAQPKYMNSPESSVFHKGRELYRLHQVRRGGLPGSIIVVEGYMDAAALHQFGWTNVVATLGTAVTADHLEALYRATPVVIFCFDGDRAGRQAAWRGLETALEHLRDNREARFLFLPEGEDPDSMVRQHGAEAMSRAVEQAQPLSRFFFDHLSAGIDLGSLDGRARLVAMAEPYLKRLPGGPFADLMQRELERISGHGGRMGIAPAPPDRQTAIAERPLTPVQFAVALIVQRPDLALDERVRLSEQSDAIKGVGFLCQLIDFCRKRPHLSSAALVEIWRGRPEHPWLARLATRETCRDEEEMPSALLGTLARIRQKQLQIRIRELQQKQMNEGGLDAGAAEELRTLLRQRLEESNHQTTAS